MNLRHVKLLAIVVLIGGIWGVVLPYLSGTETLRRRFEWLQENQIDPAAMYYTELPMMEAVLARNERSPLD